jgi:dTDP-4-amino-4,6-dideoxygalactose transaminase
MTEKMLLNQIKTYESTVERNRRYAEYYNAEFEQTGSRNAYYISRNFYRELEHSQKMLDKYRSMMSSGKYSDAEVYGN